MIPSQLARVIQAYQLLEAYANPLRAGMPLNSTELEATRLAVAILKLGRAS